MTRVKASGAEPSDDEDLGVADRVAHDLEAPLTVEGFVEPADVVSGPHEVDRVAVGTSDRVAVGLRDLSNQALVERALEVCPVHGEMMGEGGRGVEVLLRGRG